MSARAVRRLDAPTRRQRGVVVIVALTAVLMMALSAAALIRSVDTTIAISGNLGAMRTAQAALDGAVERAIAALFEVRQIADPSVDDIPHGYYAVRASGESARGVPIVLQSVANYPGAAPTIEAGEGAILRYVIERMCTAGGAPATATCELAPAGEVPLPGAPVTAAEPPWVPVYRLTARVDGPGAATAFAQAWLADLPTGRRVAWRILGD